MVDQTRFKTVRMAHSVLRDLILAKDWHDREGGSTFMLELVPEEGPDNGNVLSLIADRIDFGNPEHGLKFELDNGDDIIRTSARLRPDGEPFNISVMLPWGTSRSEPARVVVSRQMELLALYDLMFNDIAQALDESPES